MSNAPAAQSAPLMGKTFKYGMPIYGLAWHPNGSASGDVLHVCGGGGMGIKNRLVCAESRKGQLTDQVAEHLFGEDCPMRLAVSPDGRSIVFAMGQGGIHRLDQDNSGRVPKLALVTGDTLDKVRSIKGDVKSLGFSANGSLLGIGFEGGGLAVYEWPSLKQRMNLSGDNKLADGVRDLEFSLPSPSPSAPFPAEAQGSGKAPPLPPGASGAGRGGGAQGGRGQGGALLAVALDNGVCELWDWERSERVCSMEPGKMKQKLERAIVLKGDGQTSVQQLPAGTERVQVAKLRFTPDGTGHLLTLLNSPLGAYIARWAPPTPATTSLPTPGAPPPSTAPPPAPPTAPQGAGSGPERGAGEGGEGSRWVGLPRLVSCHKVSEYPCTCFDLSGDGAWLALGTSEGGVLLAYTSTCNVVLKVPKAHMVFTTGITFSPDTRYVLSASADASATVTDVGRFTAAGGKGAGAAGAGAWSCLAVSAFLLLLLLLMAMVALLLLLPEPGAAPTQSSQHASGLQAVVQALQGRVAGLLASRLGKDEL